MKERCYCIVAMQDCYGAEDQTQVSLHHDGLSWLALNPVSAHDFVLSGLQKMECGPPEILDVWPCHTPKAMSISFLPDCSSKL